MKSFTYNGKPENLQKALDIHSRRGRVMCHKCDAELVIVIDPESRAKYNQDPGIYCLANPRHMYKLLILSEPFEEFDRIFKRD